MHTARPHLKKKKQRWRSDSVLASFVPSFELQFFTHSHQQLQQLVASLQQGIKVIVINQSLACFSACARVCACLRVCGCACEWEG